MYPDALETTVTDRGQTAIPARIRRRCGIRPGQKLEWVENDGVITVLPVAKDPVGAFRGSSRGWKMTESLLQDRRDDAHRL
jgi:AbrB family looped-hinge helix DNA binding protein